MHLGIGVGNAEDLRYLFVAFNSFPSVLLFLPEVSADNTL